VDQLTFIVRFSKDEKPIERFLQFLPIEKHKAQYIADTVLIFLENLKIPIKNCRGQSYDSTANMAESILVYRKELKRNVNLQFSSHVQHFVESGKCPSGWMYFRSSSIISIRPEIVQFFFEFKQSMEIIK
jgi:hypothetical protein